MKKWLSLTYFRIGTRNCKLPHLVSGNWKSFTLCIYTGQVTILTEHKWQSPSIKYAVAFVKEYVCHKVLAYQLEECSKETAVRWTFYIRHMVKSDEESYWQTHWGQRILRYQLINTSNKSRKLWGHIWVQYLETFEELSAGFEPPFLQSVESHYASQSCPRGDLPFSLSSAQPSPFK